MSFLIGQVNSFFVVGWLALIHVRGTEFFQFVVVFGAAQWLQEKNVYLPYPNHATSLQLQGKSSINLYQN